MIALKDGVFAPGQQLRLRRTVLSGIWLAGRVEVARSPSFFKTPNSSVAAMGQSKLSGFPSCPQDVTLKEAAKTTFLWQ
jgi:hypothetical protein